jgi:hypothetical protein
MRINLGDSISVILEDDGSVNLITTHPVAIGDKIPLNKDHLIACARAVYAREVAATVKNINERGKTPIVKQELLGTDASFADPWYAADAQRLLDRE